MYSIAVVKCRFPSRYLGMCEFWQLVGGWFIFPILIRLVLKFSYWKVTGSDNK